MLKRNEKKFKRNKEDFFFKLYARSHGLFLGLFVCKSDIFGSSGLLNNS